MGDEPFSVHDQPDFARVYEEDDEVAVRRGDLRAVLDIASSSLDFGSGFLDNEQVEVLRKLAVVIGIDPVMVTPRNFIEQYVCQVKGHTWRSRTGRDDKERRFCYLCGSEDPANAP